MQILQISEDVNMYVYDLRIRAVMVSCGTTVEDDYDGSLSSTLSCSRRGKGRELS